MRLFAEADPRRTLAGMFSALRAERQPLLIPYDEGERKALHEALWAARSYAGFGALLRERGRLAGMQVLQAANKHMGRKPLGAGTFA